MGSTAPSWSLRPPPAEFAARYRRAGWWKDETLGQVVDRQLREYADRGLRIWSRERPHRATLGAAHEAARRLATGLRAQGVGPGDVVAFQLPNWAEAVVAFYGISLLGATIVPIVHFYGPKEVRFILEQSGARALVTCARFRDTDYLAGLAGYRSALGALETVVVVGGEPPRGALPFEALLEADPLERPLDVDPDSPALIGYTSGTTASPKGVIHSHNTILAECRQLSAMSMAARNPLTGAPVGHAIGMLGGLLIPLFRGFAIELIDVWDPGRVLEVMLEADLAVAGGATFFLTSLIDHPSFGPEHLARMNQMGLGGAPIPAAVADRAEAMGISVVRSYGSTEHPSSTGARHDEPRAKRNYTDGHPLEGVELRLLDEDGREVPTGEAGEITSRGPDRFVGYTDPALSDTALDPQGWYTTGDVGVLDEDGYLTITDRKKDIIIRGGENVSAAEVEELLMRMPGVAEVAVVAAPDVRLGEHGCAHFRMQAGAAAPDLEAIRKHLDAAGLARQKWPEEIRRVDDFPRTPSGKVQKFVLRARLRSEAGLS